MNQNRSESLAVMDLSLEYTLPGGDPRMRLHSASLAILMFWKEPRMRMC